MSQGSDEFLAAMETQLEASPARKRMPIKEFRDQGFILEINRRFLHPLGLALEITVDDKTGEETISGVWDSRDDPEGIVFAELGTEDFMRAFAIQQAWESRRPAREAALGYVIQPFPKRPNV